MLPRFGEAALIDCQSTKHFPPIEDATPERASVSFLYGILICFREKRGCI